VLEINAGREVHREVKIAVGPQLLGDQVVVLVLRIVNLGVEGVVIDPAVRDVLNVVPVVESA